MQEGSRKSQIRKRTSHKKPIDICQSCLFSPLNCTQCPYKRALVDIAEFTCDIIKSLPDPRRKK